MKMNQWLSAITTSFVLLMGAGACTTDAGSQQLDDTEWIADNSFEVRTLVSGTLEHEASGPYAELEVDADLQADLIASHIAYAKNRMKREDFQVNLMPDAIVDVSIERQGDTVRLSYEASVDMIRKSIWGRNVKSPSDLPKGRFNVVVPSDPVDVLDRAGDSCASDYGNYTLTEYKYFYFFNDDKAGCELPMTTIDIDVVEVYPNPTVYPEYDRLLNEFDDGTFGFFAAILPNRGDHDPMSRFEAHRKKLDRVTKVQALEENGRLRYVWRKAGATMVVDLYDPTAGNYTKTFHEALGLYQFVYYNGHSNYGNKPYLSNADAYSNDYQIIGMHSCQSYAYYTSQVAAGKATDEDPTGFVNSDVIATGKSSYPSDSPDVMGAVVEGLMKGMVAIIAGRPDRAPSWQEIGEQMRDVAPSILYGVAGARNNAWRPSTTQ